MQENVENRGKEIVLVRERGKSGISGYLKVDVERGKVCGVNLRDDVWGSTVAGVYDLRRLQIKLSMQLGHRAVLSLDCCPSLLLFVQVTETFEDPAENCTITPKMSDYLGLLKQKRDTSN